jgi:hypothetical protein
VIEAPRKRTYVLEHTRDFFTGRPDGPCSGATRLVPTDSGAATLRPAASTAALHSPDCSRAEHPTSATTRGGLWPPPAMRETCTSGAPLPQISKDWRRCGAALETASRGTLGIDTEAIDLAHDWRLCKESVSGRSEPSKRWQDEDGSSSDCLSGSARRGGSLRSSRASEPLGATRRRTTYWSSRAGRTADRELKPTFFSRAVDCGHRDDVTFVARGGADVDDPDMSLQSTAALATSPRWPHRRSTTASVMDLVDDAKPCSSSPQAYE